MPVIAVAAAFEGAAALAAGGLTAFETIAAVGGIVSGVGALTGNKDLMKIGGVAAMAGGMGAFAQGKGWIASDGAMADTSSNIDAMKNTAAPMSDANPTDARLAAGTQTTPGTVDGGGESSVVSQALSDSGGTQTTGLMNAGAPASPATTVDANAKDTLLARGDVSTPASAPKGVLDYFKEFGSWADKNKTLASIGANFIGGMFDREKKAKGDYYAAETNLVNSQIANMSSAPNMNIGSSGRVGFPASSPTYKPVQIGGLYAARGG